MRRYVRKHLEHVEGYTPGEQPREAGFIKLNTNENPYPPSPRVLDALKALDTADLRKYPDPLSTELRRACASRYGLPGEDWVVVGNGMDEILAMALRAFVDPGDKVVTVYPTYSLYEVLCQLHDCHLHYVPLDADFQFPEAMYAEIGRFCFLTRPNAPTGVAYPRETVRRFCETFDGIVLIDEAYVDFSDDTCMDFPCQFENVIVTRTFSKSYGLAGLRIGIAAARPELVSEFIKIKDSYNLNTFSQAAGLAAIEDEAYMRSRVGQVRTTRKRVRESLITMGFDVPESSSNFLLARWNGSPDAAHIFETLKEHRILVRYFKLPGLENALRITIGTDEECAALIEVLSSILLPSV
ncbi:MAG: Histidinol-phosphate aminotransferase [Candidatus Hydrogenedentes bacterium ADurb.Bin101]|jgi:histidinol-phosphate aminotransferase|nr:MAG: Histidinol-phosphate aminotransferase [Candidatus Hydrogenedentes bacterium ADurb.Bin101]HOC68883.1 histidinol-phosphate transaminase [Candidatus Hydrogenedentota bacterium]